MVSAELEPNSSPDAQGGWLYKERGIVCGPVSAAVLIDKLYSAQLDGETEISPEFGDWQVLGEVSEFAGALRKAQETIAKQKQEKALRQSKTRVAIARSAMALLSALTFGGVGFGGGSFIAAERPWEDHTDWSKRHPSLATLPEKPKPVVAVVTPTPSQELPKASEASNVNSSDVKAAAKVESARSSAREPRRTNKSKSNSKTSTAKGATQKSPSTPAAAEQPKDAVPKDAEKETKVARAPAEYNSAGLPRALTQSQIMKVLGTQKKGIANCLATEAKSNSDMPSSVTIEFVITASGKAADFKVLERAVRDGPMADCLKSRVYSLRWPAFFGENKTVKIPFNIKRR